MVLRFQCMRFSYPHALVILSTHIVNIDYTGASSLFPHTQSAGFSMNRYMVSTFFMYFACNSPTSPSSLNTPVKPRTAIFVTDI